MKNKMFPFPVLLMVGPVIASFLLGEGKIPVEELFVALLFLVAWYTIGPDLKPPVHPNYEDKERPYVPFWKRKDDYLLGLSMWQFNLRLREERTYRKKVIAISLGIILAGTAAFAWFSEGVILWRAALILCLCALGLLFLLFDWLLRRRSKKNEKDRASYPTPEVNMNYDHDALADSRVRALQLRLERLEEWRKSGMIDDKEYEDLRKKYLNLEQ